MYSGLVNPTTVQFARDGRVFVAEKSGLIKEFDNLSDKVPTTVADLRTNVYNFWDRGLLGMVLDPTILTSTSSTLTTPLLAARRPVGDNQASPLTVAPRRQGPTPTAVWPADACRACGSTSTPIP